MRLDLEQGAASDFYFIPLVGFSFTNVKAPDRKEKREIENQITEFLDTQVEQILLIRYFALNSPLKSSIYNIAQVGPFQKQNSFGGSPESGLPDKAIAFENTAWESINAASKSLGKDRRGIRPKIGKQFKALSSEEFKNFKGVKITNLNAAGYFDGKQEELEKLLQKIGFRKSNS